MLYKLSFINLCIDQQLACSVVALTTFPSSNFSAKVKFNCPLLSLSGSSTEVRQEGKEVREDGRVRVRMCVCVCVCAREREREGERWGMNRLNNFSGVVLRMFAPPWPDFCSDQRPMTPPRLLRLRDNRSNSYFSEQVIFQMYYSLSRQNNLLSSYKGAWQQLICLSDWEYVWVSITIALIRSQSSLGSAKKTEDVDLASHPVLPGLILRILKNIRRNFELSRLRWFGSRVCEDVIPFCFLSMVNYQIHSFYSM